MAECTCTWNRGRRILTNPDCPVHGENATYPTIDPYDIGPPAPGKGDDLPNPEIGMKC
jgi:hypothetical protein